MLFWVGSGCGAKLMKADASDALKRCKCNGDFPAGFPAFRANARVLSGPGGPENPQDGAAGMQSGVEYTTA
jgi:hypothetical protein